MKRYLIFAGTCFYARGGFNDLVGQADTMTEAKDAIAALQKEDHYDQDVDWWQIVDMQDGTISERSEETPLGGDTEGAAAYHMQFMDGYFVPQVVCIPEDGDDE